MKIGPIFFLLFLTVICEARDEEEIKLRKEKTQRRRLAGFVPKKLYHVETDKCLDFDTDDNGERGKLVDCDLTETKVAVHSSPNNSAFKTLQFVGGSQAGNCLDAFAQGSWFCDETTEQDWQKTTVGVKTFTLQDQNYQKFLDERQGLLRIKPEDLGCTCQHWKLVS